MTAQGTESRDAWSRRVSANGLRELCPAGTLVAVNDEYCELLGRPRSELLGHSPLEFTHPDDVDASRKSLASALDTPGVDLQQEKRFVRSDGQIRWARVTEVWRPDLQRVLAHIVDIDDIVRAREVARVETRRAQALVEHCADLIFTVGPDGRFAEANPAARALVDGKLGTPARDLIAEVVHPEDAPGVAAALAEAFQRPGVAAPILFRTRAHDGSWLHLSAVVDNQLSDPDFRTMIITAHEVTAEIEQLQHLRDHQQSLVAALSRAAEFRDPYTAGHQSAVADLAGHIAEELGLCADDVSAIALGASIHDIGKIAVPAETLSRPGRLTAPEYEIVKSHCQVGRDILGDTNLPPQVADIVLHHHERFDGSGYPDHLAGEETGLPARIVAVADTLDAMLSHRPYRPALGLTSAVAEIVDGSGTRYDPAVVEAALRVLRTKGRAPGPDPAKHHRDELAALREDRRALRDELAVLRNQTAQLRDAKAAAQAVKPRRLRGTLGT